MTVLCTPTNDAQRVALQLLGWEGPDADGDYVLAVKAVPGVAVLLRPVDGTGDRLYGRLVGAWNLSSRDFYRDGPDPVALAAAYQRHLNGGTHEP